MALASWSFLLFNCPFPFHSCQLLTYATQSKQLAPYLVPVPIVIGTGSRGTYVDSASVALSTSEYDGAGAITISLISTSRVGVTGDNPRYILRYLLCVGERDVIINHDLARAPYISSPMVWVGSNNMANSDAV
jgi:hypothetical protein